MSNRGKFLLVLGLSGLFHVSAVSGESVRGKVKAGNHLFGEGKFEDALKKYTDAQVDEPTSSIIHYNIGDVLYKQEKYDKAAEEFTKALSSDDPKLASDAYYNYGNSLFREGKLGEAIEAYQKALKWNPDHEDAKYNLEFVRKKLKENAKQEQSESSQQNEQQQKSGSSEEQKGQQDESKKEQQGKKQEAGNAEEQKPQQPQQAQAEQQKQKENQMTEQEANRILDAIEGEEKEQQKKQMRARFPEGKKRGIDW
jgi:Ca-activated chloride channel family protein